ncbi:MAG TPA: hypothetical protein VFW58_05445 [Trichococcus sp.]|nr:hypothetical protein [Trichococcus sp.]
MQQAYIDTVQAFYDLGCRYLQLDDVHWGFLCNFANDSEEYKASKRVAALLMRTSRPSSKRNRQTLS